VIVKQLFGGIGKNFANPAIVGRIVLLVSFSTGMTTWTIPSVNKYIDGVSSATPLAQGQSAVGSAFTYLNMFMGDIGGSLGEVCKLTLLIGFAYLLIRRVITPTAPVAFMGTVYLFAWALGADPLFHLLAGGVMLGAIFMATDYSTTPTTELGKLIFGIGCGIITIVIRLYAAYPEGVSFAILIMNILTPHIDSLTANKAFGGAYKK
jgi:electron transport complex protein RnfD